MPASDWSDETVEAILVHPLVDRSTEKSVVVWFRKPEWDGKSWRCEVGFRGFNGDRGVTGYGVDGIQALVAAIQRVRTMLLETGTQLTSQDGTPAHVAFPPIVPTVYGLDLVDRVSSFIQEEVVAAQRERSTKGGGAGPGSGRSGKT